MKTTIPIRLALLLLPLIGFACQAAPKFDYSTYLEHQPRSILVLPPLDETLEVNASYGSLSTLTRPLVERGFYVFPVALVDAVLRQNGLPTPGEMHQVPLSKLREVFDPDAVLYVTVSNWGTSYQVINSQSAVTLRGVLVDASTGTELWHGEQTAARGSGDGGGGLAGLLAAAVVNQIATSISDPSRGISEQAAGMLFGNPNVGLLLGPYHPDHEAGIVQARANVAEAQAGSN